MREERRGPKASGAWSTHTPAIRRRLEHKSRVRLIYAHTRGDLIKFSPAGGRTDRYVSADAAVSALPQLWPAIDELSHGRRKYRDSHTRRTSLSRAIFSYVGGSGLRSMVKAIRTLSDCGVYNNILTITESTFKYLFEKYRIAGSDLWVLRVQNRCTSRGSVANQSYTTNPG